MKRFLFISFLLFFSCFSAFSEEEITTIKIENSQKTEYKKDPDTGNETIILDGAVVLSVTKGSTVTNVSANRVSYDRVTKMLYASGDVHLITKGNNSGDDDIQASTLIMNTSTLEGVFDGGKVIQTKSDAINLPSGSTLVVFSDLFGKSETNVLSFKNASMTFCDDEDPHWKINASRMWLLSGGEFAFFNALLFVGKVPVLYLPAFYYPKDELVFNPVFGYRQREGYYIQTTAYLYGRKPLNTQSNVFSSSSSSSSTEGDDADANAALDSLYNFMKPSSLKEQKLEGIVLHNLEEDYKGDSSQYLKIIGDWYSNLGFLVGLDGNFVPKNGYISKTAFTVDLGFSNTIFKNKDIYTNISSAGQKYWDDSNFMGIHLPFRYRVNLEFSLAKPFRFSLSLPIYSDPFYAYDFRKRSEDLNWISSVKELVEKKKDETSSSEVSSFTWQANASYSPNIPEFMKPYISSVLLSATSSINVSSVQNSELKSINKDSWAVYTPTRRFFYPSQITPITGNVSVSGTLFQYPFKKISKNNSDKPVFDVSLFKPELLMSDEEIEKKLEDKIKNDVLIDEKAEDDFALVNISDLTTAENVIVNENNQGEDTTESEQRFIDNLKLPELKFTVPSSSEIPGIEYSLGYSINPNITTQYSYASNGLKTPEDFTWDRYRSYMYTIKMPASLNSKLSYGGSFFSMTNSFSYQPVWQAHPIISTDLDIGGYSESSAKSIQNTDYKAERQDLLNTNKVSVKPFTYLPFVSESGITWDTNIKLFRREFIGDVDNPEWDNKGVDWTDKESVTVNTLSVVLAGNELNNTLKQSLTFSAALPPLDDKYSATLNLSFPYTSFNFSGGFYKTTDNGKDKWVKNPIQQSASFSIDLFKSKLTVTESFNYNLEDNVPDSFKTSVSWDKLSFSYTMSNTFAYDFIQDIGWKQIGTKKEDKKFLPYSLSFSYAPSSKTFYSWKNRVSFSFALNTSITADLLKPTNSYFIFSPSITFKLNQFFDLTFSSTSRNSVIYRYFQTMAGHQGRIGGEENLFIDLFDSFRFDDESKRKASGFKLKSLNLTMSHNLHDWKFNMSCKIEPRLVTEDNGSKYYDFSPYLSIGIIWAPMEAIKTQIIDEYGKWKLD
ncbi:MAG: LPS-assembly protein LptD [Treponema sp.]|nr:LPS-assembly protein LptD [Treponema sp.]